VVAAAQNTGKPAFAVASLPENFDEALAVRMAAPNVVPMMGLETALGAIKAAQTGPSRGGWRPWPAMGDRKLSMRDEASSKALIAGAGVAVPRSVTALTLAELAERAAGLTAPLALKGLGFAHKTEAGAVRLGLTSLEGQAGMAGAQGYLAEEMVTGVVAELLVGLRRDPVYGATVTLGFGGVTAEVLADTVTLVLPVTVEEVAAALRRLRLWPLLDGYRGRPKADVAAVVRAVMDLQAVMQARPALEEIEINPLMLTATGAVAVDAVIWEEAE
jgi:succinyl-CoA synthetase beta subunit